MRRYLPKFRLFLFLLVHHLRPLLARKLTFQKFFLSIKRQIIMSSRFRNAKYSQVGKKTFIDPFAPYFPSSYCLKLFNNNASANYPPKPNFAQISITNRCPCSCIHCHVKNTQDGDLDRDIIFETIREISDADFPLIFFVGGEPMSRFDDLVEFIQLAQKTMDTRIFTSGVGATRKRLRTLQRAGLEGLCVSLDHHREHIHNAKRNNPYAFKAACETIREASSIKLYVSVVCCTTSSMVRSGDTFKTVDLAESLGAHSIQINEIRPVGRAAESQQSDLFLTKEDKQALIQYYERQNRSNRKIAIVMPWYNEEPHMFGCTATSGQQVYIDAKGNVQPCPLLKLGLGNITLQKFDHIWKTFRTHCGPPVNVCLVYQLAELLKNSDSLPLAPAETYEIWKKVCRLEPADIYQQALNRGLIY